MMGTWPPASRSRARMAAVASSPPSLRHLHIHQDHVERLRGARLDGLTAVPDHDDPVAALPEQSEHELLIRGVVLGHEHAE